MSRNYRKLLFLIVSIATIHFWIVLRHQYQDNSLANIIKESQSSVITLKNLPSFGPVSYVFNLGSIIESSPSASENFEVATFLLFRGNPSAQLGSFCVFSSGYQEGTEQYISVNVTHLSIKKFMNNGRTFSLVVFRCQSTIRTSPANAQKLLIS